MTDPETTRRSAPAEAPGTRETPAERERLRSFFAEVHSHDAPPPFGRLVARPRRAPRSAWRWAAGAAVLLLAAALGWNVLRESRPAPDSPPALDELALAASLSGWRAPLDFLLETPGAELLTATPSFAASSPELPDVDDIERKETL